MKIISVFLAAFLIAPASNARPLQSKCFDFDGGWVFCEKAIGTSSIKLTVNNEFENQGFIAVRNCVTGDIKTRDVDGFTQSEIRYLTNLTCK